MKGGLDRGRQGRSTDGRSQAVVGRRSEMAVTIVRLGTPRGASEGLRLGTVRRPPRGVPKTQYAKQDWFDVWLPNLSPSPELIRGARVRP